MKKTTRILLIALSLSLLVPALCLPIAADVIWEPDNDFFTTHRNACEYVGVRSYLTNGEGGYAVMVSDPVSKTEVRAVPNGEKISMGFTYADGGVLWILNNTGEGWFRADDLALVYDSIQFIEDHKSALVDFDAESMSDDIPLDKAVVLWAYPGEPGNLFPSSHTADLSMAEMIERGYFEKVWVDAQGRSWGLINYYLGNRNVWVCLSQPDLDGSAEDLPSVPDTAVMIPAAAAADLPVFSAQASAGEDRLPTALLVGGLVVLVVGATAVLIGIFYRKKES